MSLIQMQASPTVIALVIYELQHYENLKFLDISGNDVSYEAAESLCDLIDNTKALEFLNLRSCLKAFLPARKLFQSLWQSKTIKYLNLSGNRFNAADYEFGSRIGRLLQLNTVLKHLDIQNCLLTREEILFITMCLR